MNDNIDTNQRPSLDFFTSHIPGIAAAMAALDVVQYASMATDKTLKPGTPVGVRGAATGFACIQAALSVFHGSGYSWEEVAAITDVVRDDLAKAHVKCNPDAKAAS